MDLLCDTSFAQGLLGCAISLSHVKIEHCGTMTRLHGYTKHCVVQPT